MIKKVPSFKKKLRVSQEILISTFHQLLILINFNQAKKFILKRAEHTITKTKTTHLSAEPYSRRTRYSK